MEYTLLDTIKSGGRIRKNDLFKFQSLPQGVKELSYIRTMFFLKIWYIVFEGTLDLDRLNKICKDKKYLLINADEVEESDGYKAWKENFREGLNWLGAEYTKTPRLGDKLFTLRKPDKEYYVYKLSYVYKLRKEISHVWWHERTQEIYFCTSRRKGLELAEDYRRSLLKW